MSVDSLLSDTPEIKSGVALTENEQKLLDTFRLLDGDSQIIALANLIKFARSASTAGGKTEEFGSDSNTSVPVLAGMDMASVRGV
jgi:hypothetical protein